MTKIFAAYADLAHAIGVAFRTPRFLALLFFTTLIASAGAFAFRLLEGWSLIDSFYFSVVSMATVGYGDLAPKTPAGRIFTIGFLLVGIGMFVLTVSTLAEIVIREIRRSMADAGDPPRKD
ncbi:potassium channel family protein [Tabrizicola sp. J26]|jgi:voltage-gated potassium channel Kch|uniref:potassium channel family protein n=1 Tax=Alitabrizicola rongguiensis TaxID=2909234 RepID=UPI001F34285B|nr:potassium channel family protein [Tabrizicola rongguiensis]MCF1710601.1 potassium channel family protein [Tabrizicola rongguiensis]